MRALGCMLLAGISCFALSNAVTVYDLTGSPQIRRVVTIPRWFAQGEICNYPQPFTGGAAVPYWQADVLNRWPADAACAAGYVKFAMVTAEVTIPATTLAGTQTSTGSLAVEFRGSSSASSGGAGMSQSDMLNFNTGAGAGVWPSRMTLSTGGVTFQVSAKSMISGNYYQVLANGPLRTSVLVREGPDAAAATSTRSTSIGWQCTANCTAPYTSATWANNSTY